MRISFYGTICFIIKPQGQNKPDIFSDIIVLCNKQHFIYSRATVGGSSGKIDLLQNRHFFDGRIDRLIDGSAGVFTSRLHFGNKNEKIFMDFRFSLIKDSFGDVLGVLVIGKEIKEMRHFRSYYRLTGKESEIIQGILNGHTNAEMAGHLGISENTVKRHITNIYNKLHVRNKIDMMNLLKELYVPEGENKTGNYRQ
jgi:DNA-binding CsgD family transcriptional regulator